MMKSIEPSSLFRTLCHGSIRCLVFASSLVFATHTATLQAADSNLRLWSPPSTTKVRPNDPPPAQGPPAAVTVKGARNETVSFQVVLTGAVSYTNLDVRLDPFVASGSTRLAAWSAAQLYRVGFISVVAPSDPAGATGEWPDPLYPIGTDRYYGEKRNGTPFDLTMNRNQPIWISVDIPNNAAAGTYSSTFKVVQASGGAVVQSLAVTLLVWNFTLPDRPAARTTYGFDTYQTYCYHYAGGTSGCDWDQQKIDALTAAYWKEAIAHRVTLDGTVAGVSYSYDPPTDTISAVDWTSLDSVYSLPNATTYPIPGPQFDWNDSSHAWTEAETREAVNFWKLVASHFQANGWYDRAFLYTQDEPHEAWPLNIVQANALAAADPRLRALVTSEYTPELAAGKIGIWCPIVNSLDEGGGISRYDAERAAGKQIWWYDSDSSGDGDNATGTVFGIWPDEFIDHPAVNQRVHAWLQWKYGLDGYLYYAATECYRNDNPDVWSSNDCFGRNGDGTLFYPGTPSKIGGTTHIPVPSLRLELLRMSWNDFDYLALAAAAGQKDYADGLAASLVTSSSDWNHDPAAYDAAREQLASRLSSTPVTADLSASGNHSPEPVPVGQLLTYTIVATNSGPSDATNVRITDTLPDVVSFVSASSTQGTCTGGAGVSCALGGLAHGSSATVTIVVTANFPGQTSNTANVSGTEIDPNLGNNSTTIQATIVDANAPVTAAFTLDPWPACPKTAINFLDLSEGAPSAWAWDFGDGSTSTLQNPVHSWTFPGAYPVTLKVTNGLGATSTATASYVSQCSVDGFTPVVAVPGVARSAGNEGSFFKTFLWLTNPTVAPMSVRLTYVASPGSLHFGNNQTISLLLRPGEAKTYDDPLGTLFGVDKNSSGVITLWAPSGAIFPRTSAWTFNSAAAAGTYGQYIEGVDLTSAKGLPIGKSYLTGLTGNDASRTNVGVVNLSDDEMDATLTLQDALGNQLGSPVSVHVLPRTTLQTNSVNIAAGAGIQNLFTVQVTSTKPHFAYASKLDNKTSDPVFEPDNLPARTKQWIDGVASSPGAFGTYFRSTLAIANPGSVHQDVTISYVPRGSGTPVDSASIGLDPGQSRYFSDVLQELFTLSGTAGSLRIDGGAVTAWTRTYNDVATGTFGQFIPAFGEESMIAGAAQTVSGLSESTGFRTNVGALNPDVTPVKVEFEVILPDGSSAGKLTETIPGGGASFLGRYLNTLSGRSDLSGVYLKVTPESGRRVYAWASVVDNGSGDAIFVWPAK